MAEIDPRYPIGKFADSLERTPERRATLFRELQNAPAELRAAVSGLSDRQLDTPYREGGWTIRQLVHHVADSHMHSYLRMKFTVASEKPAIMPYDENVWVTHADANGPIEPSLALLHALHMRWVMFLRSLPAESFERVFVHPASGEQTLARAVEVYAWHGKHHIAHIVAARRLGS